MKTAISIPDSLFKDAERAAKELSLSRSELYAKAVAAFIAHQRQADVTEKLNAVYSEERSTIDAVLVRLQSTSIPRESW
jgi:metal-responsive CopG/Arc/MetJ family transcriptional regulator